MAWFSSLDTIGKIIYVTDGIILLFFLRFLAKRIFLFFLPKGIDHIHNSHEREFRFKNPPGEFIEGPVPNGRFTQFHMLVCKEFACNAVEPYPAENFLLLEDWFKEQIIRKYSKRGLKVVIPSYVK